MYRENCIQGETLVKTNFGKFNSHICGNKLHKRLSLSKEIVAYDIIKRNLI